MITLAVDCMGGDHGPSVTLVACRRFLHSHPDARLLLVGDVLFSGSVGRTDFPRSDSDALLASIREKFWPLGDDVAFISGHGPMSTLGEERRSNPYCADE